MVFFARLFTSHDHPNKLVIQNVSSAGLNLRNARPINVRMQIAQFLAQFQLSQATLQSQCLNRQPADILPLPFHADNIPQDAGGCVLIWNTAISSFNRITLFFDVNEI
jgi:hypothetical protein